MASLVQENQDIDDRPTFSATTPHFFKIILDDTSRDTKLRIPKKFVKKCGEHLSNPIHLKLPCGSEWEVEVTTCDGELWFEKGWPKISEFYSLDYGDFLVFRYEKSSVFHVCIFDRSATEIDYPITLPEMEETDDEDVECVEILDDFPPCPKTRDKSPLPCPQPRKKKRISTSTKQNVGRMRSLTENEKAISLSRAIAFKSEKPHCKVTNCDTFDIGTSSSVDPSPASKENECPPQGQGKVETRSSTSSLKALEAASNFTSNNPFFRATLGLRSSYRVRVPLGFSEHFIEKKKQIVMLWVKNRWWPVNLNVYSRNGFELSAGWGSFAKENRLKEGDVCIFELIDRNDILLKVHMFRC